MRLDDLPGAVEELLAPALAVYGDTPPVVSVLLASADGTVLLDRDARVRHSSASLLKLPVALTVARLVDSGRAGLDTELELVNCFPSSAGGSFACDPREDADPGLYARLGGRAPVRELLHRMIAWSSDLATDNLLGLTSPAEVTTVAAGLGAGDVRISRYICDLPGLALGVPNELSAADAARLLLALLVGRATRPDTRALLMAALEDQRFGTEIPLGLPPGTRVAHKTGWTAEVLHDAALVSPAEGPPFVLAVLTSGFVDQPTARRLIRGIAALCYKAAGGA